MLGIRVVPVQLSKIERADAVEVVVVALPIGTAADVTRIEVVLVLPVMPGFVEQDRCTISGRIGGRAKIE